MFKKILANLYKPIWQQCARVITSNDETKLLIGKLLSLKLQEIQVGNIHDTEFKVFSQWGDDGIIQYLVSRLDIPVKKFIEFGVANYTESNTRFLLINNNWAGLVMDCSKENINFIKSDEIYWKHDLTAIHTFITAENINLTLSSAQFSGEIGLLHIDVDGNDYWIWKAIECVSPIIAIVEYNSLFGSERAITVPYNPDFDRVKAHHSGLYAGASLQAMCDLAQTKGYVFVGSNSAGNNAYFVKKDRIGSIPALTVDEGYVASAFREHRDKNGCLTFLSGKNAIKSIAKMQVVNTRTNQMEGF